MKVESVLASWHLREANESEFATPGRWPMSLKETVLLWQKVGARVQPHPTLTPPYVRFAM